MRRQLAPRGGQAGSHVGIQLPEPGLERGAASQELHRTPQLRLGLGSGLGLLLLLLLLLLQGGEGGGQRGEVRREGGLERGEEGLELGAAGQGGAPVDGGLGVEWSGREWSGGEGRGMRM